MENRNILSKPHIILGHFQIQIVYKNKLTWACIYSSGWSARICRAIMQLRSRMHCLSLSDKPRAGTGTGWNGTPALPLARKECKTPDNTLCGGPEMKYVESHNSVLYFGIFVNSKLENTVESKVNSIFI
jgi:hypothetical protein